MKTYINTLLIALILVGTTANTFAQDSRNIDNYRQPDKRGVNVFEDPKDTISSFDNLHVRMGGSFALQFQGLDHENSGDVALAGITPNFNLPTANLDLDVALAPGVRMHLRTYLSSRHHNEPYVKGGFFQVDKLDFIKEGFLDDIMKYTTIRIGQMENNYGDAHFRRSDNAQAIFNPFVGNLIMDSFTTEIGAEVYYQRDGFIGMVGFTNGKLNQSVEENANGKSGGASFLAKLGYDKQLNSDLRVRLTGSLYNTGFIPSVYLYNADRAGSRYYHVLQAESAESDNFRSGRFAPSFKNSITAVMINPFVKYKGLEFFGTIEMNQGTTNATTTSEALDGETQQYAGELIYRFGQNENFYLGGRYNLVDSQYDGTDDVTIERFQASMGWFMTKNILAKLEYVTQSYDGYTGQYEDAKFDGVMFEAVISF
ncbi:hypothetical protein [Formosa algae]|uniref:Porin n=1 Tax=Formosa algae TaxID=225843 RepID=A0A9X1CBA0_9FLAO|nr:hypothetical protein [Formosa algae]MBP1839837.1 hypothetical protein [Formosa algae]MDQ0335436.1 hypothetical protein [Formosa algae]OEI79013.1 hypothetical protein AST99_16550 [Formosa algae]PNW28056.1 hypothetical protein BKP44_10410 [Formosa algae]